jgi:hypothetical protein
MTNTPTPTPTPTEAGFLAYVLPEPQDGTSQADLGQYMFDNGSGQYYGYSNSGGLAAGPTYQSDMSLYIQWSGWTGGVGNFITDVSTLSSSIRQEVGAGIDTFGCPQNQYTFGTIEIQTAEINPNIQYVYTVWLPLNGVGGSMNNMTVDAGEGAACSITIVDNGIPDSGNSGTNVTVPSGCAIPAGTYRVLWLSNLFLYPLTLPLTQPIYIKGDTKS